MPSEVEVLEQEIAALRAENIRLRAAHDLAIAGNRRQCAHILSLPTEILDRILYQLSDQKSDIAACRLVCREFRDISSPRLIPSVTFSRRLDTLEKLFDVLEHPYFSQHVTELVWDASWWDEDMTFSLNDYRLNAINSARGFIDERAEAEAETWTALWPRLRGYTHRSHDHAVTPFGELDEGDEAADDFRYSHVLGQYQYGRFWIAQKAMADHHVPETALRACILKLPKLRKLVYTDFRALVKDGDGNYEQFCQGTLGHAAPPRHLYNEETDDGVIYQDFSMIFEHFAREGPPSLNSFSIGRNPFGTTLSDAEGHMWEENRPQALSHRYLSSIDKDFDISNALGALQHVRELRLPQRFSSMYDGVEEHLKETVETSSMPQLLTACATHLVKLIFTAEDLFLRMPDAHKVRYQVKDGGAFALEMLLFRTTFERLRCLDLRGWIIHKESFSEFLHGHRATLRQMRLVNNIVTDEHAEPDHALASAAGPSLCLLGVAVDKLTAQSKLQKEKHYTEQQCRELETLWLQGRSNLLEKVTLRQKVRVSAWRFKWREWERWAE